MEATMIRRNALLSLALGATVAAGATTAGAQQVKGQMGPSAHATAPAAPAAPAAHVTAGPIVDVRPLQAAAAPKRQTAARAVAADTTSAKAKATRVRKHHRYSTRTTPRPGATSVRHDSARRDSTAAKATTGASPKKP
jgi:hypothetical protein